MCGIFGCVERGGAAIENILRGLRCLEYRGYDACGLAWMNGDRVRVEKVVGRIDDLEKRLEGRGKEIDIGIGHTRWATHGRNKEENAHPHLDCAGEIALVHNGIIDNYLVLRKELGDKGHNFKSETDSEIVVHLIEELNRETPLPQVLEKLFHILEGSFALLVLHRLHPETLYALRRKSPLIIGAGGKGHFVASDVNALSSFTSDILELAEGEVGIITKEEVKFFQRGGMTAKKPKHLFTPVSRKKKEGNFPHHMLEEIFEQEESMEIAFEDKIEVGEGKVLFPQLDSLPLPSRIIVTGCGTSWHAGLIGKYYLEKFSRIPSTTEYASEFRYGESVVDGSTWIIALSQSGETADTLAAVEMAREKGATTIGIVNVPFSSIHRLAECSLFLNAGKEIGVAATKSFTSQLVLLLLLSLYLGRRKEILSPVEIREYLRELTEIPKKVRRILNLNEELKDTALRYLRYPHALYLGRGINYPIALEGALKLKEVSYIHAEGYPAAEMKHGPLALVDVEMPVVVVAPRGSLYSKILNNISEVKARGGKLIVVTTGKNEEVQSFAEEVVNIPSSLEELSPLLTVIPLQLLAYYIAVDRGCDVDKPRNLAKSVTVE